MKLILTTTKDVVTGEMAQQPLMFRNEAEATRTFAHAMKNLKNDDGIPVSDYQLYKIGTIDPQLLSYFASYLHYNELKYLTILSPRHILEFYHR